MPRFDSTGPEGNGSRTGRGLGKCKPNSQQSESQNNPEDVPMGRRAGLRSGRGRGNGNGLGRGRL
jgi:hypothetical protein